MNERGVFREEGGNVESADHFAGVIFVGTPTMRVKRERDRAAWNTPVVSKLRLEIPRSSRRAVP